MILCFGIQVFFQDVQVGQFDIVLVEVLDCISCDQVDVVIFYKYLKFVGVFIVMLFEGEISEFYVGFKGMMNVLFLKDFVVKIYCGICGCVEDGKLGGGLCFGYNVVK